MERIEFEQLRYVQREQDEILSVDDLVNKNPRTLIYGYTCTRDTFHVYLEGSRIHIVVYNSTTEVSEKIAENNYDFIPDKRVYPEKCDYEFCGLLRKKDINIPFTTWNDLEEEKQFYGKTLAHT